MAEARIMLTIMTVLLTSLILFLAINFLLQKFPLTKQNTYCNVERSEQFLYSNISYPIVIVGSGLTGNLNLDSIGHHKLFNLFFPYAGSCVGIEMIYKSNKFPQKVLLVETNYIFKGFDDSLNSRVFDNRTFKLKSALPLFQKRHRFKSLVKAVLNLLPQTHPQIISYQMTDATIDQSIAQPFQLVPVDTQFKLIGDRLKNYLDKISNRGCKIIFFEMPIDPRLANAPLSVFQRQELERIFPKSNYEWITPEGEQKYLTEDGIHLTTESSQRYSDYLSKRVAAIIN